MMEINRNLCWVLTILLNRIAVCEIVCDQVSEGNHYKDGGYLGIGDFGFVSGETRKVKVTFDENASQYSGIDCMTSWNKLWGSSRCGYLQHHHSDSDRFVWRKHGATP